MKQGSDKCLIVITGPTAVGKTIFSIKLAQHFNTEILSADSRQFYREMRIGTAYPEPEELAAVKHHFLGNLSIAEDYNVARYETEAMALLDELFKKHQVLILSGGSGLYIDAISRGIDDLPDHDPTLREELKAELDEIGLEAFGEKLKALDPEYFEVVDLNNPNRLLRAIEVCIQTGKTYTSLRRNTKKERPFRIIKIGLNMERDLLFKRIEERVDRMMKNALLEEVKSLLPYRDHNALNTVGYKELFRYLDEEVSLEQAVENIKTNSRRYAKRQLTWFKRDTDIHWFEAGDVESVLKFLESMD
ncbi:MAG: tRNA (adenosine(37)-N6)-dimethylallyltransferase MiaA [Bacteroidetes bacterium]|nr:MAG: tRNA (adenosine(37)-N6)-dimethylallyltransferase MiaA [Bacteroidota bacterium]